MSTEKKEEGMEVGRRSLGQRKRKQKFDVKQLLNMRKSNSSSSMMSSTTTSTRAATTTTTTTTTSATSKTSTTTTTTATTTSSSSSTTSLTDADSGVTNDNRPGRRSSKESSRRVDEAASVLVEGKRERKRKRFWDEEIDDVNVANKMAIMDERRESNKKRKLSLSKGLSSSTTKRSKSSKSSKESEISAKERESDTPAVQQTEVEEAEMKSEKEEDSGQKMDKSEDISQGCTGHEEDKAMKGTEEKETKKDDDDVKTPIGQEASSDEEANIKKNTTTETSDKPNPKRSKISFPKYTELDLNASPAVLSEQLREGVNIPGPGSPLVLDSPFLPPGWERRVVERKVGVTKGKWEVLMFSPSGKSFRSKMDLSRYVVERQLSHLFPEQAFDFSLDEPLKRLRQIWKQAFSCVPSSSRSCLSSTVVRSSKKKGGGKSHNGVHGVHSSKSRKSSEVVGIESETGQGVRCAHCKKLFRTELLLHEHIKHYHGDLFKSLSSTQHKLDASGMKPETPGAAERSFSCAGPRLSSEVADRAVGGMGDSTEHELGATPRTTTTTSPPTYRVSRRRQAEMSRRRLSLSRQPSGEPTPNYMEAFLSFLGTSAPNETGDESNSYPPSELDGNSVVSEHLTSEEIVNCVCKRTEEDGLMIQCDICLCWQHSICLGLDDGEQLIPEKYICHLCRHAKATRSKSRFSLDTDWLKEGKLPRLESILGEQQDSQKQEQWNEAEEVLFERLSNLMADLVNLQPVLHAIQVKLQVAKENSGKVFIWSSPWQAPEPPTHGGSQSDSNGFKDDLGVDTIEPTMIPSASEVQTLMNAGLEGGIGLSNDECNTSQDEDDGQPQMIVPEQKRLDKDVSRKYLLDHIVIMQDKVNRALDVIEMRLQKLENRSFESENDRMMEDKRLELQTKSVSTMIMQDLALARQLVSDISTKD